MKVAAIISEYNPLHNGHKLHIDKTKKELNCDYLISIMSGNFVQRGLPSYIDKWNKSKVCVSNGIDLVIELPVIFSLSSAEFFAKGSAQILNSLGIVDYLSFGSEVGDIEPLKLIASILCNEPHAYKSLLKYNLSYGLAFAKARSLALTEYITNNFPMYTIDFITNLLSSSNNILAIEYLKALYSLDSTIEPFTIKRLGSNYNDEGLSASFSSATSIRNHLKTSDDLTLLKSHLPKSSYTLIETLIKDNYTFPQMENIFPFIKYKALTDNNSLKQIPEASEGLYNKIYKSLWDSSTYEESFSKMKSKRYASTRINRLLCQYFIGFENYSIDNLRRSDPSYIRVLAFNHKGAELLKKIKSTSSLQIYTKLPKSLCPMLELDLQSTKAYSILNPSIRYNEDYFKSPIIIK
ncbi:nucleotidyltransferase [Clostridium algidicarnis]|uniref:nucleotidyltransferase n=1 Tax=Clostridium algidicarnis TaxID=37659 RepID=UPI001C0D894E|nr:nucleotidyltransferase [Clostridium algidicarnis]MBU3226887.1 nucleotidyltransferase [Clostridium algidicarnis]MBU3250202.1 nucleotidyltransferase [Clostridium algidicarnis]